VNFHQLLLTLGSTPEEIANTLRHLGIRGMRVSANHNPIALYLRQVGAKGDVTVTQTNVRASDYLFQTPDAVSHFLRLFDCGGMPELVQP
jgi:hypothetical protein